MSTNIAYDFIEAGIRIFGLQGIDAQGNCQCGNPDCKALYKHPIASNWQHTPEWSDEQLEVMQEMGQLDTGYGVIVKGLLVVDVDARNGGVESYGRLCKDIGLDLHHNTGLAVLTGSGQGSMHIYYRAPEGVSLVTSHPNYKGVDFKSSGFCVGPGSLHISGNTYEVMDGSPHNIGQAPDALISLLTRPDYFRAEYNGESMDVTDADLAEMIRHVSPDSEHEIWVRCGMALHHATQGTGFDIWDQWSSKGASYPGSHALERRWHSFGKGANPVTLGTLVFHAEAGGWQPPVSFENTTVFDCDAETGAELAPVQKKAGDAPFHTDGVDLLRPPGFVGEVCKWVNEQTLFPRDSLSVAVALQAISNIVGLRYTDDVDGVTANLFTICVAGSATGKESALQSLGALHKAAGISAAVAGSIKSEQEIVRNLTEHQAALYVIDEFGLTLKKITNSKEAYHEGVIAMLMAAYSKANSFMQLTGDTKRDVRKELLGMIKSGRKAISENEDPTGSIQRGIPKLERALQMINEGLEKPYVSMIGFTTPVTFEQLVTPEQSTNGFIGRAIIVTEKETNPRAKKGFKKKPMSDRMQMSLSSLYDGHTLDGDNYRIEYYDERAVIRTEAEAVVMLDQVADWAWEKAEMHKQKTGFEAIPRRAREMVSKLSLILAVPGGIRTAEHVRWAYAFIERDIREKTMLAYANEVEADNPEEALKTKIMTLLSDDHSETGGVIVGKFRAIERKTKGIVQKALDALVKSGALQVEESKHPQNGRTVLRYSQK